MFGGNYGNVDVGYTDFADYQSPGTVDWAQWQTPQPVTIESISLFAGQDVNPDNRNFSRFSLYDYDTGTGQWDLLYTIYPADPYGNTVAPANTFIDTSYPYWSLCLAANITPTTAQQFRALNL